MGMMIFFLLFVSMGIIGVALLTGRTRLIPGMIPLFVVLMVGWMVFGQVNDVLKEQFGGEVTGDSTPIRTSDIDKFCEGKSGTKTVLVCEDSAGRVCSSKSVDCSATNQKFQPKPRNSGTNLSSDLTALGGIQNISSLMGGFMFIFVLVTLGAIIFKFVGGRDDW